MIEFDKRKNRFGFSLFEVVVTMSIVVIFIAACSNVFTMRRKARIAVPAHGRMECYYVTKTEGEGENATTSQVLHQRLFYEHTLSTDEDLADDATQCRFDPPSSASFLIVSAVGGGGAGGATKGGSAGDFKNEFIPIVSHTLYLRPGHGAVYSLNSPQDGEPSLVLDGGKDGSDIDGPQVVRVAGGISASTTTPDRYGNCTLTYTRYNCGKDQYCEVDYSNLNSIQVHVGRCISNDHNAYNNFEIANVALARVLENASSQDGIVSYEKTRDTSTLCSGIDGTRDYAFAINKIGNTGESEDISHMTDYAHSLGITDGIGAERPGNGGVKKEEGSTNHDGGTGAVLIVW